MSSNGRARAALRSAPWEQYDSYTGPAGRPPMMAMDGEALPSADELGAELEQFLAEQNRRDD